jgi:hypothetical protein
MSTLVFLLFSDKKPMGDSVGNVNGNFVFLLKAPAVPENSSFTDQIFQFKLCTIEPGTIGPEEVFALVF